MASLILNENNKSVIYLGQSVPLKSLDILNDYFTISKIMFFAIAQSSVNRLEKVITYLDETFSGSEIFPIARIQNKSLKEFKNVTVISSIDEFNAILK